jgi:hypothetical protein
VTRWEGLMGSIKILDENLTYVPNQT